MEEKTDEQRALFVRADLDRAAALADGLERAENPVLTSGVKSYTGCLNVNGTSAGTVNRIKEGEAPLKPCGSGQVQVHFSGGDISKISVGSGLSLPNGGDTGEVTIQLDAKYSLPQSCVSQQVAKWNGSAWECANDNDTTYSAGTGLDLNETEFRIQAQYRVQNDPDCASGQFATGFNADGDIQCAAPSVSGPEVWVTPLIVAKRLLWARRAC